jgi:sugar lactone lactonase YvrE
MDGDARSGRWWVASVRHRTVVELAPGKAPRELWPRDQREMGAVLGVRADARRGVLWVTTSHVANARDDGATGEAALLRVRMADGTVERRWTLPASERGRVLGDVAIGPRGDVWVTDSQDPALYRLRPGADTLERLTSPLFHSPQGMAPSPDGRVVYVADYSHGLLRVDVATGAVTRLDDAPGSTAIGCDGIAWYRGAIVAVQNGVAPARVMRFTLDATGRRIVRAEVLDQQPEVADEPTIGAVIGDRFVYVANSAWEKYHDGGSRVPGTRLARPMLLAVPLR